MDLHIRYDTYYNGDGYEKAIRDLKALEANYKNITEKTLKTPMNASGALTNIRKILNTQVGKGVEYDAKKTAEDYVKQYLKVLQTSIQKGTDVNAVKKAFSNFSKNLMTIDPNLAKSQMAEFQQVLNNVEQGTYRASNAFTRFFDSFKNQFKTVFSRLIGINLAIKAFGKLKQVIKESLQLYGEAEQKMSKYMSVFDKAYNPLMNAVQLANKLGLATSTTANALATIGDMLQAQGATVVDSLQLATEWAEKLQDIIRFKDLGISLDEFASNFMSGAMGNTRNFRSFGSVVRESTVEMELAKKGMSQLTGQTLEYEKMLIRANLALKQQDNALGATKREWDTYLAIKERYDEAQKAFKENGLGFIATFSQGWMKHWTPVLENAAKKAQATKLYDNYDVKSGEEFASPYNLQNEKDYKMFVNEIEDALNNSEFAEVKGDEDLDEIKKYAQYIYGLMVQFGASMEDFKKAMKDAGKSSLLIEKNVANIFAENKAVFDANKQKVLEKNDYDKAYEQVVNFEEAINAIEGRLSVRSKAVDWDTLQETKKRYGKISDTFNAEKNTVYLELGKDAINSVVNSTSSNYGKALEESLGQYQRIDLLKDQEKTFKSLYEVLKNTYNISGGVIDNDEQSVLDAIFELLKANIEEQQAITGKEEKQEEKSVLDIDAELKKIAEGDALFFAKQLEEATGSFDLLNEQVGGIASLYERAYDLYNEDLTITEAEQAELQKIIDSYVIYNGLLQDAINLKKEESDANDYFEKLGEDFEKNDFIKGKRAEGYSKKEAENLWKVEKELLKARKHFNALSKDGGQTALINGELKTWEEVEDAIKANIEEIGKNTMAISSLSDVYKNLMGVLNTGTGDVLGDLGTALGAFVVGAFEQTGYGKVINAAIQGFQNGGVWGALIEVVMSVLDRLDGFDRFQELGEEFLNMFANMFDPLMPMLTMIAETINALVPLIASVVFPIMKFISMIVVGIEGTLGELTSAVLGIVEFFTGDNYVNPIKQALYNTAEDFGISHGNGSWDTALKLMGYIGSMTYQTASNTEKTDSEKLQAWQEMYENGLISLSELSGLWNSLKGVQTDLVKTYDFGSYRSVGNTTTVYQDDVKIVIEGSNLNAEEIAIKVAQYWERQRRAGANTSWTAVSA